MAMRLAGTRRVAERLRNALADITIHTAHDGMYFTARFGVSLLLPGADPNSALQAGDKALYAARHGGHNRVETVAPEHRPDTEDE